jgi:hypothetical protein
VDVKVNILRTTVGARNPNAVAELNQKGEIISKQESLESLEFLTGAPINGFAEDTRIGFNWGIPLQARWLPDSDPVSGQQKPAFDDPQQGPAPDCYYLATLGSLALKGKINPICAETGYLAIYSPNLDKTYWSFGKKRVSDFRVKPMNYCQITWQLPLTKTVEPAGAKSKQSNVMWVPFYEKAYACYLEAVREGKFVSDTPDLRIIPEGDADTAFKLLTGTKPITFLTKNNTKTTLELLRQMCPVVSNVPSQIISSPAVAFTYSESDPEITKNLNPAIDSAPSGVVYETPDGRADELVSKKHSYSLIGLHTLNRGKDDEKNFVILRNPYGFNIELSTISKNYKLLDYSTLTFGTFTYPPKPADGSDPPTVNVYNGVFGIEVGDFAKWFMGFRYIN